MTLSRSFLRCTPTRVLKEVRSIVSIMRLRKLKVSSIDGGVGKRGIHSARGVLTVSIRRCLQAIGKRGIELAVEARFQQTLKKVTISSDGTEAPWRVANT